MGIAFSWLEYLSDLQALKSGMKILDVGSSNLYSAKSSKICSFIQQYSSGNHPIFSSSELEAFAKRIEEGSLFDPVTGGRNEAWAGELLEKAGFAYTSIDIAQGYKTEIFDLNRDAVPPEWHNYFDLVINCGTTEHVCNQLHCFQCIHEMTSPEGFMMHQLPLSGYTDHCYFVYTGRFFFDLCLNNNYEIVDIRYDKGSISDLLSSARGYKEYFPCLKKITQRDIVPVPDHSITILLKKTDDAPFIIPVDRSTSVTKV